MTDRSRVPFLEGPRPRVIAHRGFDRSGPGNTLAAFEQALDAGADLLETDVRASLDAVAFLQHDEDVLSPSGVRLRVDRTRAEDLSSARLEGGEHPATLSEALRRFPVARFNIDVKARDAIGPTIEAVRAAHAESRVLITSFSESRRRRTLRALPGAATSASAPLFVLALVAAHLNAPRLVRRVLRGIDALQVPETALGLRVTAPRILTRLRSSGCEIHLWTIDDPERMSELLELGVDGIVTDRTDLARAVVDAFRGRSAPLR